MPTSPVPNVLVATPCYGGLMTHVYVHSLLKMMSFRGDLRFSVGLVTSAHDSLITRSRNALVRTFLDTPTATHLLFIDADIGFEPVAVQRLLAFDEDVVAGMYPVKVVYWARISARVEPGVSEEVLRQAGTHFVGVPCTGADREERGGFVTGSYAGTGFMMIKRTVIERMISAYPETQYRVMQTFPATKPGGAPFYNLFDCMIDAETGTYLSEDFTFCHRFRKIGGKIWLDTESRLHHVGSMEFQGDARVELGKYRAVGSTTEAIAAE